MKSIGFGGLLAALVHLSFFMPSAANAGRGKPCDSCATCTEMLAKPGAEVAVSGPLKGSAPGADACITIRGEGATFDGSRETIEAGTAVAIEADDVVVRHLRAAGGERALYVTGDRATIIDAQITEGKVGVLVDGAADFRMVRSAIERVAIGIAFDDVPATACGDGDRLRSPGAVLQRVTISGAGVGIAACEAMPVVANGTITGNGTGWVQGQPRGERKAPYDPCVCSPSLEGVAPGTTLLYSSGCSGSLFHEGLLPDVQAQGHDIKLRQYGRENRAVQNVYDAYVRRCAPEITDAIGIPGCMPNYACPANGEVSKRRGDDDRLVVDHRLSTADDVADFAARCVSAAATHYDGDRCRTQAMRGTTLCDNETDVKSAMTLTGVSNTCSGPKALDCSPCGAPAATPTPRAAPPAPAPVPKPAPTPKPAPAQPAPTQPAPAQPAPAQPIPDDPAPAAAEARTPDPAPGERGLPAWWLPLIGLPLGAGLGVFFARRRP